MTSHYRTSRAMKHRESLPVRKRAFALRGTVLAVAALMVLTLSSTLSAQDDDGQVIPWEYRPYRVQLFVAFDSSPWFAPARRDRLLLSFEQQSFREGGSAWEVTASEAPGPLAGYLAQGVDGLSVEQIINFDEQLIEANDKLIFLQLRESHCEFHAEARELDCRTRYWGPIRRRMAIQPELIASQAYDAVLSAFAPIVRVGRKLDEKTVDCSLRAGYLITQPNSPAQLQQQEVLLPITRHNDRDGKPRPDGIVPAPWTYLSVASIEGGKVVCDLHSGVRNSIGARSSRRKERLALAINLEPATTELVLQTAGKEPTPLVGYEIHSKDPFADSPFEFLGRTDWDGAITIPPGSSRLRILYVKNGDRVLNRLPMVPGLETQLIAELIDDSRRLEAEGFVSGIEAKIMDLVAMRALLAASIDRELKQGNIDKAEEQLKRFRDLPSQSELAVALEQEHKRIVASSADARLRGRIDAVFNNARSLLTAMVDPGQGARLESEVARGRSGSGSPPQTQPASPSAPPATPPTTPPATPQPAATPPAEDTPAENDDPFGGFGSDS